MADFLYGPRKGPATPPGAAALDVEPMSFDTSRTLSDPRSPRHAPPRAERIPLHVAVVGVGAAAAAIVVTLPSLIVTATTALGGALLLYGLLLWGFSRR